jgi:transcription initiation factor TFIIB
MTIIGRTDKDFSGHELNVAMRSTFERLRSWDKRMRTYGSRRTGISNNASPWKIFYRLGILKVRLGLPSIIVEKAAYRYRKAQQRKLVSGGRTISAVLAAAVYITCREIGTPRALK